MIEEISMMDGDLFHVYNRFPVVFDHGNGMYMYDIEGKEYLDFASGIGVMALGHNDADFVNAIKDQADKMFHTSNLYYSMPLKDAAAKLCQVSGMSKVFFTNSGAEAIEGAIKTAKKYAYNRDGHADHEVIAMNHSFHGRTVGSLSVTGTEHYREPFYPLMDGVKFADFNYLDSIKAQVTDKTCAIILEPIQGEGGIYPARIDFLQQVKALCKEKDILLILDEIQCGVGRTGSWYAFQQYDIKPDILTTAKAIGGGLPVGAFLVSKKVAKNSLVPGDHGTTYGGNPLCCKAVATSLSLIESKELIENVNRTTPYLEETLDKFVEKYDFVTARRGMGFMQGLVLTVPVGEVVKKCLDNGLIVLSAGADVLRFLPPLICTSSEIIRMEKILTSVFDSFK